MLADGSTGFRGRQAQAVSQAEHIAKPRMPERVLIDFNSPVFVHRRTLDEEIGGAHRRRDVQHVVMNRDAFSAVEILENRFLRLRSNFNPLVTEEKLDLLHSTTYSGGRSVLSCIHIDRICDAKL